MRIKLPAKRRIIISISIREASSCSRLMQTGCKQRSDHTAINRAGEWVVCQWASAGRTTHKFVEGETQAASHHYSDQDAQNHTFDLHLRFIRSHEQQEGYRNSAWLKIARV